MSARAPGIAARTAYSARLALIVPLAPERQCFVEPQSNPANALVSIVQCGQGAASAAAAARNAIAQGATALLSAGVAGGLMQDVAVGDAVIAHSVFDAASGSSFRCSDSWSRELYRRVAASGRVHGGNIVSVNEVLGNQSSKRDVARRFESVACDMESAAVAAVAHEADVHFATLRVISDAWCDELPAGVEEWVDSKGNARVLPAMQAMLSPSNWRPVISMWTRFRKAQRRIRRVSLDLNADSYCCPQSRVT